MRIDDSQPDLITPEAIAAITILIGILITAPIVVTAYGRVRKWIKRKRKSNHRRRVFKVQTRRIEALGLRVEDRRGWVDGQYQDRRYELRNKADGTFVAGPFQSRGEALKAARTLKKEHRLKAGRLIEEEQEVV